MRSIGAFLSVATAILLSGCAVPPVSTGKGAILSDGIDKLAIVYVDPKDYQRSAIPHGGGYVPMQLSSLPMRSERAADLLAKYMSEVLPGLVARDVLDTTFTVIGKNELPRSVSNYDKLVPPSDNLVRKILLIVPTSTGVDCFTDCQIKFLVETSLVDLDRQEVVWHGRTTILENPKVLHIDADNITSYWSLTAAQLRKTGFIGATAVARAPAVSRPAPPSAAAPSQPAPVPGGAAPPGGIKLDPAQLEAAQKGDAKAQNEIGAKYWISSFTNPLQKSAFQAEALKWIRAAADQGDAVGQLNLGQLYSGGFGVPVDKAEAARLFRLAANQGLAGGQNALAAMYIAGTGVPLDYAEARNWLLRAAAQNYGDAPNALGLMYEKGQGVAVDPAEAARWLQRAADRGHATAADNLAGYYAVGRGVTQNMTLAYFWYDFAATHLTNRTQKDAAGVNRDLTAQKLSPDQIKIAQAVARTWKIGVNVEAALATGAPGMASAMPTRPRSSGTGFVVSHSGHVLTNALVVNQCREIRARLPGSTDQMAELIAKDDQNDLAVLKLPRVPAHVATFRVNPGVREGDAIVVYGFPLGDALAADGNLTTGNVSALSGMRNDSRMLQVSAPVQPGNSGGPLVDMSGNVVGMVMSKLNGLATMIVTGDVPQNVNFAIKVSIVRNFLEANGVKYQSAAASQALSAADVGELVKQYTMKLECMP